MQISLYDVTVASYTQALEGLANVLERGRTHLEANHADLQQIVDRRLIADMQPFAYQVNAVTHHSVGALAGLASGSFSPPAPLPVLTYADLQDRIAQARETLAGHTPEQVNAWQDRDVTFSVGSRSIPFRAPQFILSFSLPNLYFHATTAYDILRMEGVPIGKRDYSGTMRIKS